MKKKNPTILVNASRLVVLQGSVTHDGFVFHVSASLDSVFHASASQDSVFRVNVSRGSVFLVNASRGSVFLVDKRRERDQFKHWSLLVELIKPNFTFIFATAVDSQ